MASTNRRKNGKGIPLSDNEKAKKEAELLHALLMLRMRPLGKKVTMYLVPTGYDILKNRRVRFQKRKSVITGEEELFLPKDKLEPVTVIRSAYFDHFSSSLPMKYYLVLSKSAKSHTRIVWGGYCTALESTELMAPYVFRKESEK